VKPPTCEASGFSNVFKQKVSLAFTKPTEQLATGWKFNSGGAGQAAQSTVKTSTSAAQSSYTTRFDPSVGAFVPGVSEYCCKPGNSTSSTQTRSYGDLPPGGGTSARAGWGTTQMSSPTFVSSGSTFVLKNSGHTTVPPSARGSTFALSSSQASRSSIPHTSHLDTPVQPTTRVAGWSGMEPPSSFTAAFSAQPQEEVSSPDGWIHNIERHRSTAAPGFRSFFRLPKIELPKFSGDPMKWPMLIQTFGAQVDRCCQDDSERQSFLRSCLSTEIQMQLGECLLHPGLYERCLQEVHRKFGNPSSHRNGLLESATGVGAFS
jgi:hypothetical protein